MLVKIILTIAPLIIGLGKPYPEKKTIFTDTYSRNYLNIILPEIEPISSNQNLKIGTFCFAFLDNFWKQLDEEKTKTEFVDDGTEKMLMKNKSSFIFMGVVFFLAAIGAISSKSN